MIKFQSIIIFVFFFLLISCGQDEQKQKKQIDDRLVKEQLARANKYLVKAEEQNIRDFISRYHYDMTETGSGLFYEVYKKNKDGQAAVKGKWVQLNFKVFLLSGELIYSSEKEGLKEFRIGKGGVESGLEEGILLMKTGEKARFIIPSHLAFGLLGDLEKIPQKATIVYDVELVNLMNK